VDGSVDVLLHDLLGNQNGVLEVITVPRHERDEHVAAEGEFAVIGAGAVANDLALVDLLAFFHERLLVHAGARVRAHVLAKFIDVDALLGIVLELLLAFGHLAVGGDHDEVAGDRRDLAGTFRHDDGAGIAGDLALHSGADERRFRLDQRHALALHVRAHERAIRIVVLEERDQAGRHGDELLERHVHVVDAVGFDFEEVALVTHGDFRLGVSAVAVHRRAGLGHDEILSWSAVR